jgi:hypothetical protein
MNKIVRVVIVILFLQIILIYVKPASAEILNGIWIDDLYLKVLKFSFSPLDFRIKQMWALIFR